MPDLRDPDIIDPAMPCIYLIRHEEPEMRGRFIGRTDPPLTPAGLEAAAAKLAGLEVAAIYASPLRRARQTAEAIGGPAPIILPDLAEIDFGEWEGLTWQEIDRKSTRLNSSHLG